VPKVALITGASYGVGAATAMALARDGFRIAVTATQTENLAATVEAVSTEGSRALAIPLDLASQASIEAAVTVVEDEFGPVDVLVNNAAVNLRKRAVEVTHAEWNAVISTNITGTFFITQLVARHLIESGRPGSVVNIASVHGLLGVAERSAYGISKGALIQMTRMLAVEWAEHGIRVNAVAPGRLDTASPSRAATGQNPAYMQEMLKRIPLHRLATAEDVAAAVSYLAGPTAAAVTGHVLVLDGGLSVA
jgi:NAD(P)-dependent dehydrogenase (short-subunit alcohol dehydrogenase family)